MSQSNVSGWLPNLIGPVVIKKGDGSSAPARPAIQFLGCTFTDDGTATIITPNAQSSLVPDGSGFVNVSGPVKSTANPKCTKTDIELGLNTPNSTATNLYLSAVTVAAHQYTLDGIITALSSTGAAYGKYRIDALYTNVGGTLTQQMATPVIESAESSSSVTLVCDTDGAGRIRVRMTVGIATPLQWNLTLLLRDQTF